jgi:anionic cell wall polymer biosynthesis LytR-Cps2A-Psr (LCP) family protein
MNFEGFARMMDILGGVDLNVEERMYFPEEGIDLQPGLQHLDGEQCLAFVRYRYYPEGDIARVQKQQQFLSALIDQHFTLANVLKLPAIFDAIVPYVSTNLSLDKAISLGKALASMNMNQVQMQMVPGVAEMIDGISYWVLDDVALNAILHAWDHPEESVTNTPGVQETVSPDGSTLDAGGQVETSSPVDGSAPTPLASESQAP